MAVCEILCVGTELLLGDILNTNSQFLSVELAKLGISVLHQSTIGDNHDRLSMALKEALGRSDIVVVTGGLGPTPDDITREVCCKTLGFDLVQDDAILDKIRTFFNKRGNEMPPTNAKQAQVPVGGTVFHNDNGTAPGLGLEKDGKCVVMLPGPPYELEPMFLNKVRPFLMKYSDGIIVSHTVRTMNIGESAMAETVCDLLDSENPTVAPYAKRGEAMLRVTAKAPTQEIAELLCLPMIAEIRRRLGSYVYAEDDDCIEQTLVRMLRENGKKIACAESITGGSIAKRITDVSGSSEIFEYGAVTYSNASKQKLLGVSAETLSEYGAVSSQTAAEMAKGVAELSGADIGISATGIAGPLGDGVCQTAGLAFIGLYANGITWVEKVETGRNDREYNRHVTASRALNLARLYLEELSQQEM